MILCFVYLFMGDTSTVLKANGRGKSSVRGLLRVMKAGSQGDSEGGWGRQKRVVGQDHTSVCALSFAFSHGLGN